ncbi:MAG: Phosphoribosylformylglycinamidine synthase subunit PurS [Firmicutes bacterium]|nr:Phosphoribosylformylglycinamidine synthase subunit PurS [Bacillota bacterium]MBT9152945.1 Phosphoribosylformylglycinamidine synthase subunit PurS [Bacillota bacterium]MBT9157385.1 Phosphoribosylformylglycinamidine synthase subunit PurS [Bacillota bacterium]
MYKAKIYVTLKEGVLDPQGQAVRAGLISQGFAAVEEVRIGKFMEVVVATHSATEAQHLVREMCERLLANPVIEDYTFVLVEVV